MKNYSFLLLIVILITGKCFSQVKEDKDLLSFSLGGSFPIGRFSSTSSSSNLSGFAIAGENANISFERKINNSFGLIALLYGSRNGINRKAYAQQFAETSFYPGSAFPTWTIKRANWFAESFLAGCKEKFNLDNDAKLFFTARATIGIVHASLSKFSGSSTTDSDAVFIQQKSADGFGLAFLAGAGLQYHFTKRIYLLFNADYFGTNKIEFKNVTNSVIVARGFVLPNMPVLSNAMSFSYNSSISNQHQPVYSINASAGISIAL